MIAKDSGNIGERFAAELRRLAEDNGIPKSQLAEYIGLTTRQAKAIEIGSLKWLKPHIMAAMVVVGFDVHYVLTGRPTMINDRQESTLLDNYRNSTPERQASLREVGPAFAQPILTNRKAE